jgi:hypothetical protein
MSAVVSSPAADFRSSTDHRSVDELDAAIGRLVRQMNADSYRMLTLVREFDDRFGWKKWSCKSCAEWLAWRSSITLSAAREKVRAAHALRSLPAISAAFADGRLSYSKVRALTRVAHACDEDLLLAHALEATVAQVEERCRQIRNVSPRSVHHARHAWEHRSLTVWRNEARGTLRFTVEVPIEDGELVVRALDHAVAAGEVTTDVDPDAVAESRGTAWRAQQADALIAVARRYLDGGTYGESASTADHHQVVIHADAKSLAGGAGLADLPIASVKRLLCDCSVVLVAEDDHGDPLDVGRKQRTVSTPLKRALYARDRGCTFPGCHRKRYLDGHHLRHWVDGGETSAHNMTLLCTHHHRQLHEGGFSIVRDEGGTLRFVTADGRSIPRHGYRLEDFVDDALEESAGHDTTTEPSREGFCTTTVQRDWEPSEVRETAAVYRIQRNASA